MFRTEGLVRMVRGMTVEYLVIGRGDKSYMRAYSEENVPYTNGSFTPKSTAGARFSEGAKAGADLIARLESGQTTLKAGETIKIVGHSQGLAYAAGIASALAKHSK